MCGGDTPEVKESEAERALAREAGKRFLEWEGDGYKQLETDAIADSKRDISSKLKSRSNADVEQSAKGLGLTNSLDIASAARATSAANLAARAQANINSENYGLNKRIGMAKVGQNVQGVAQQSLSELARQGASTARNDAQIKLEDSLRRSESMGQLAGYGAMGAMMASGGTPDTAGLMFKDNRVDQSSNGRIVAGGQFIASGGR